VYHRFQSVPEILFVAGSQVDLQWVIPAYEAAEARGLQCAFAGPNLSVPSGAKYIDISVHALRFAHATIMVTATSGLTESRMPRCCTHRVAIPHSLVSLHMVYPLGTFDGYTDVFCCGEHHKTEIDAMNRMYGITDRKSALIGYGKFEHLTITRSGDEARRGSCPHILIGPSWGPGNILEAMGELLLARLLADGYQVTLRPHPSFFIDGDPLVDRIVASLQDNPAFVLESSMEESKALWAADIMIADYSGVAMEFAFIRESPVLFVDVPPKVLNPRWSELGLTPLEISLRERIGVVVSPTVDEVLGGLSSLLQDDSQWPGRIRREREHYWVNFGNFGEACAEELGRMFADEQ
jgi:hypothetical protein